MTEVVQMPLGVRHELEAEQCAHQEILDVARSLTVTDEESFEAVTGFLREIKAQYKALDARKQSVTKPLLAVVEEVRGWFRPAQTLLQQTEQHLKQLILQYRTEVERRNAEAMRQLAEAADRQDLAAVAAVKFADAPRAKGVSVRETWDWRVVDAAQVPREYLSVDPTKVDEHIKAAGKQTPEPIPGIEMFRKAALTVRA